MGELISDVIFSSLLMLSVADFFQAAVYSVCVILRRYLR